MKRIISILIMVALAATIFAGCTGGKDDSSKPSSGGSSNSGSNSDSGSKTLDEVIEDIYNEKRPDLGLSTTPIEISNADLLKSFTGLTDASKIKSAVASEPMISSQAYSVVLVKVNNASDAKSVAEEMLQGIDQRKWICVEAEKVDVVASGDTILLVMIQEDLADTMSNKDVVDSFKKVMGGKLDFELSK